MAVIACLGLDPFLLGLVGRLRPDDDVVEITPADLARPAARRYGAIVVVPGETYRPGPQTPALLAERMVVIRGHDDGWVPSAHPGPVLRRPVDAGELRLALSTVVPSRRWARIRQRVGQLPVDTSAEGIFAVARVGASTAAAALTLTLPGTSPTWLVVAIFVWSVIRVWLRQESIGFVLVDVALVATAILLTGGTDSPFLLLAAVVAAEVGHTLPAGLGATVVGAATVGGLVPLVLAFRQGETAAADIVAWGTLIPISNVIGVMGARISASRDSGNVELLEQLHDTLDRLSKQAQGVAGTLAVQGVVEQVLASMREDIGARAGLVLLGDTDVLSVAGSFGTVRPMPSRGIIERGRRDIRLPTILTDPLPEGDVVVCALRSWGVDRGALVVVPGVTSPRDTEAALEGLAREAAVALANAELFENIRELTVDGERRRLARDLHDGVVQSLVHVRFELDLVRRMLDPEPARDVERVREVVGQAVDEVRATVNDLRSVRLSDGLGTALMALVREYEGGPVRVVVDAAPTATLTPEAELQLLRITQEALSNAVHHGRATAVYVRLWEDPSEVHLQVLDNGVGIDPAPVAAGRGVGLRAMQERAELLGAVLDLGPGTDGGTCVQVDVPVERGAS